MKKKLSVILIVEIIILILLNIFKVDIFNFQNIYQIPYYQISNILKELSLTGIVGNLLSWIIYIFISSIPLFLLYFKIRRKNTDNVDYLLILISILLFITIYRGINPSYIMIGFLGGIDKVIYLSIITTEVILLYIVLKFIKKDFGNKNIINYIVGILFLTNIVAIYNIFGNRLNEVLNIISPWFVGRENNIPEVMDMINYHIIEEVLVFINSNILDIIYIFLNMGFISVLLNIKDKLEESLIIEQLYKLEKNIKNFLVISILVNLIINIIFMIYSSYFFSAELRINININLIIYILIIGFVVKYLINVMEIKKENEMFI